MQNQRSWRRWLMAFVVVLLAHGAVVLAALAVQSPDEPMVGEGAPMVVELAAFAAPAENTGTETMAAPSQPTPEPPAEPDAVTEPVEPEASIEPEPEPELSTSPREITLNDAQPEARVAEDHAAARQQQASTAQASEQGESNDAQLTRLRAHWQAEVSAHLERHKRYPHAARARREEGTAKVRFKIDRQGRVLNTNLERSSGSFLLDREVQSVVRRAQPLPMPPADVAGDTLELVWQVEFAIRL